MARRAAEVAGVWPEKMKSGGGNPRNAFAGFSFLGGNEFALDRLSLAFPRYSRGKPKKRQ